MGTVSSSFLIVFLTIVVSRMIGQESSGTFTFTFNIAQTFWMFSMLGGRNFQITDIDREFNYQIYFWAKIFAVVVSTLLAFIFLFFNSYNSEIIFLIIIYLFFKNTDAISDTIQGFLQSNERLYQAGISLTFKFLIALSSFSLVLFVTKNLILASLILMFFNLCWTIFYEGLMVKRLSKGMSTFFSYRFEWYKIKALFKKIWPLVLESFFIGIYMNIARYFIQMWHPSTQPYFGILFLPMSFIGMLVTTIIAPKMVKLSEISKVNKKRFIGEVNKLIIVLCGVGILIYFVSILIGTRVLTLVFGINVMNYTFDLGVIIISSLFFGLLQLILNMLTVIRVLKIQALILIIAVVFQILSSLILIYPLGILGASLSILLASIFSFGISYIILVKEIKKIIE